VPARWHSGFPAWRGTSAQINQITIGSVRRFPEETTVEDFPLWLKLFVWGTIALTVGYTVWGMLQSVMQS
jgi:hypothetical protein